MIEITLFIFSANRTIEGCWKRGKRSVKKEMKWSLCYLAALALVSVGAWYGRAFEVNDKLSIGD